MSVPKILSARKATQKLLEDTIKAIGKPATRQEQETLENAETINQIVEAVARWSLSDKDGADRDHQLMIELYDIELG